MNVLVLSHMFPNRLYANAGIFVLEQAKALRAAGVSLRVVSPTPLAPRSMSFVPGVRKYSVIPPHSVVDGFYIEHPRVPTLPKNLAFAWSGIMFYLSCRKLLERMIREWGVDVIHAHAVLPDGFAAILLGREFGVPVVCTAHGADVNVYPRHNRFVRWASRWSLRHADHVVAVSGNLRDEAFVLAGTRAISVVHNGADSEIFRFRPQAEAREKLKLSVKGKLITFVGYLRSEKALAYLLEAFAHLRASDTHLCLVGDGPLKDALISKAKELGVIDQCLFAGERPHSEIPLWISASDCIVLPSLSEGLPTILPEAMLCGIPVIATPVGGIPEIIRDAETGLLVECRDSRGLAQSIEQLLWDDALARRIAARAQEFAGNSLTWARNARAMLEIYQDTVRRFAARRTAKRHNRKLDSVTVH
jgi:glycosyltransferase involved in cell wall biosynthesis